MFEIFTWLADLLVFELMGLAPASKLGDALHFFVEDSSKILVLLVVMIYAIGWLRAGLDLDRVRNLLARRGRGAGYLLAALFGAVTPFCSCSSIPLFLGFTYARIPLGITMAFLITSPIINEVAVVVLWGLLGWQFTLVYVAIGLLAGIGGGWLMDALRGERWLTPLAQEMAGSAPTSCCTTGCSSPAQRPVTKPDWRQRHQFALSETGEIARQVWYWVLIGVALGAGLHGYVPTDFFQQHFGSEQWWSVPAAVAMGSALYANVTGIIPVMESLLLKGLPVGTTLALCISTVAVSIPEFVMLKQVMQWRLLGLLLGYVLVAFTLVGWLLNAVGHHLL